MKIQKLIDKIKVPSVPSIESIIRLKNKTVYHYKDETEMSIPALTDPTKKVSGKFRVSYYVYSIDDEHSDFIRDYASSITWVELVSLDWTMISSHSPFYYYIPVSHFKRKKLKLSL